jgi:hypothetical protein
MIKKIIIWGNYENVENIAYKYKVDEREKLRGLSKIIMKIEPKRYIVWLNILFFCLLQLTFGCSKKEEINIDYRKEMREFVKGISCYAKNFDQSFIVIPQNGQMLLNTLNPKVSN